MAREHLDLRCAVRMGRAPNAPSSAMEALALPLGSGRHLLALLAANQGMPRESVIGRVAAQHLRLVVKRLKESDLTPAELLHKAMSMVAAQLRRETLGKAIKGMPTGPSAAFVLWAEEQLHVGHVGNARAVLCRGGRVIALTTDHTVAQEALARTEIDAGGLSGHPGYRKVTRWLGQTEDLSEVDFRMTPVPVSAGDVLLLLSDGVHTRLSDKELAQMTGTHADPDALARTLMDDAKSSWAVGEYGAIAVASLPEPSNPVTALNTAGEESQEEGDKQKPLSEPAEEVLPPGTDNTESADPWALADETSPLAREQPEADDGTVKVHGLSASAYLWGALILALVAGVSIGYWIAVGDDSATSGSAPRAAQPEVVEEAHARKKDLASSEIRGLEASNLDVALKGKPPSKTAVKPVIGPAVARPESPADAASERAKVAKCRAALDRAEGQEEDPCKELELVENKVFSVCWKTQNKAARELWSARMNEVGEACTAARSERILASSKEVEPYCVSQIQLMDKMRISTLDQCESARRFKDSLKKGKCGAGASSGAFEDAARNVGSRCVKVRKERCKHKVDKLKKSLAKAKELQGGRRIALCKSLREQVGKVGEGDKTVCNATELSLKNNGGPTPTLERFREVRDQINEECR